MAESDRMVGVGLNWRDLPSNYVLHPSNLSIPDFKSERSELLEYVGMLDTNIVWLIRGSEGQR